jgi:hypothetical protein
LSAKRPKTCAGPMPGAKAANPRGTLLEDCYHVTPPGA